MPLPPQAISTPNLDTDTSALSEVNWFLKIASTIIGFASKDFFNVLGFNDKEPIWASNYNQELAKCNMGLNLSRGRPIDLYSSNRIASYIGNGLLTFIDHRTGLQKIFNKNEAVYYKSTEDLIKKIIFFKKNDKIRKRIAKNGYIKYHKLYNSESLSKKIINLVYNSKK